VVRWAGWGGGWGRRHMKPCGGYSNNSKAVVTLPWVPGGGGWERCRLHRKKKSCGDGGDIKICPEDGLRDQIYYVDKVYCLKGKGTIILLN
jgi:hypothetical protein